jgi:hypothetical protein
LKEFGEWRQAKRTIMGLIKVYMDFEYPSVEIKTFIKKVIEEAAL